MKRKCLSYISRCQRKEQRGSGHGYARMNLCKRQGDLPDPSMGGGSKDISFTWGLRHALVKGEMHLITVTKLKILKKFTGSLLLQAGAEGSISCHRAELG